MSLRKIYSICIHIYSDTLLISYLPLNQYFLSPNTCSFHPLLFCHLKLAPKQPFKLILQSYFFCPQSCIHRSKLSVAYLNQLGLQSPQNSIHLKSKCETCLDRCRAGDAYGLVGSSHHVLESGVIVFKPAPIHDGGDDIGRRIIHRT